jgi:hypothetical protein
MWEIMAGLLAYIGEKKDGGTSIPNIIIIIYRLD